MEFTYTPTATEWAIAAGVFGIGSLVLTVLVKIAAPILVGTFRAPGREAAAAPPSTALAR